ncbi:N-acetylneuraminate lyase-like isoform X1 [Nasonia vitripennis]|uniref:N-acetylneuraminate lyase n=1 Tax=Nasonia vitripennis TaxID=7425 RepID=A0A7M7QZU3_NASVI|nr:N-acetylneuraminate lyase-like isoform X1 [Nasonia vitripennis]XP_032457064.1 N-acetylneuraminate lyase-like isoform X1 [Nasonia vitripennis]XP_032457065.1 N-acetylneuraminate lyase-like isoform X1 [Nasonia vitripennis]
MTAAAKFNFKGIIATAFTPFRHDSVRSLNLEVIPQYAKYFQIKEFGAVLINGTYGEGMAMSTEERIQVAEAWSEAVKETKQHLMVQVGGTNLQDVKKLASHAQNIRANSILCLPELYYKPKTVEELIDYLKEVGEAAPEIPLFYYHSPDATGVNLNMAEFFKKVDNKIPSLGGVKFAVADLDACYKALRAAANRFKIILANNYILPASISIGIDTFMPTSMNVAPDLVKKIVRLAETGFFSDAQVYQTQLAHAIDQIADINNGVAMAPMKYVTSLTAPINVGPTRKPLRTFDTPEDEAQIVLLSKHLMVS